MNIPCSSATTTHPLPKGSSSVVGGVLGGDITGVVVGVVITIVCVILILVKCRSKKEFKQDGFRKTAGEVFMINNYYVTTCMCMYNLNSESSHHLTHTLQFSSTPTHYMENMKIVYINQHN